MHELALFGIALALIAATVLLHAYGTMLWMEYMVRKYTARDGDIRYGKAMQVLLITTVVLLFLHLLEVLLWAIAYQVITPESEIANLEQAFYFSLVTFTTLGYGDITLGPEWRVLSGIEALNGVLLVGWSTAFLFSVLQRTWEYKHKK